MLNQNAFYRGVGSQIWILQKKYLVQSGNFKNDKKRVD